MKLETKTTQGESRVVSNPAFRNQVFSPTKTREFLLAAYREGAIDKFLTDSNVRHFFLPRRVRRYNIAISYFSTAKSIEQIARAYSNPQQVVTRQAISLTVIRTIKEIRDYASAELQEKFPLEQIPTNKRGQLNTRMARGLSHGSRIAQAVVLLQEGKSLKEINKSLGSAALIQARRNFKSLNIPYSDKYLLSAQVRQEIIDPNLTIVQIKALWNKITLETAKRLPREGLALSLNDLAGIAGLHIKPTQISKLLPALKRSDIIIGKYQRKITSNGREIWKKYYFLRTADIGKAKKSLEEAEEFKKFFENPVKLISGTATTEPTSTELARKRGYNNINKLGKRYYIKFGSGGVVTRDFFENCPEPIFRYRGSTYYSINLEERIVNFIQRRLRELGL